MARFMGLSGSVGFLHRFDPEKMIEWAKLLKDESILCVPSVGTKVEDYALVDDIAPYSDAILIDIAHGDNQMVVDMIKHIKKNYPKIDVIAGNIATRDGFRRLADAGSDAVRVGISGGSACTTKYITGSGAPTLASVMDCEQLSQEYGIPIIADGGFRQSGDIVKALAFGASTVCLGSMLSASSESPGDMLHLPDGDFKEYFGMASTKAQEKYKGGLRRGTAAEGIDKLVPYKGETETVLESILGGIRSGLTYSGARTIEELYQNSEYYILKSKLQ